MAFHSIPSLDTDMKANYDDMGTHLAPKQSAVARKSVFRIESYGNWSGELQGQNRNQNLLHRSSSALQLMRPALEK
jgi:hypothetical protein